MSNNMKNIEFEIPAYSDWQDAAIKALKGNHLSHYSQKQLKVLHYSRFTRKKV